MYHTIISMKICIYTYGKNKTEYELTITGSEDTIRECNKILGMKDNNSVFITLYMENDNFVSLFKQEYPSININRIITYKYAW